ncbi:MULTISPECIES: FadR/GntR family transcriptional regulator [unclassified Mycobacterium]|uniref:FadR/GntR family transcriptional regulator n=1 Tax=unclassified Mycobacterium TaxID=2642494 RepID=UPI0029C66AFB|nr:MULTISPECIES: FCD domain-containing protein [unclassified Mycobacterium]
MSKTFSRVVPARPSDQVARQLRAAVVSGEYPVGAALPTERELSEQFGVSRSAVRQALSSLQLQGLLEIRPGSGGGPFVVDRRMEPAVNAFENLFALADVTQEQFLAVKTVLEPAVAAWAAMNADETDLDRLRNNVDECDRELKAGRSVTQLVLDFHVMLAEATKNPILALMVSALERIVERLRASPEYQGGENWQLLVDEHRELLAAVTEAAPERAHRLAEQHSQTVWGDRAMQQPASGSSTEL